MVQETLVLGIGNTIRGDDAVGIFVVRAFKKENKATFVDVKETQEAGLNLLGFLTGYQKAVIVDSIVTAKGKPGDIHRLTKSQLCEVKSLYSSHQIGLATLIKLCKRLKIDLPKDVILYAVEIEQQYSFSENSLSSILEKRITKVVSLIQEEVN
jgi:hydrogenase maturation protease